MSSWQQLALPFLLVLSRLFFFSGQKVSVSGKRDNAATLTPGHVLDADALRKSTRHENG